MPNCYIETLGCQMNKADSERMFGLLSEIDYKPTEDINAADLLIMNTCTIREGAADRAYSNLGRWNKLKQKKPDIRIALAGCLAQEKGEEIQKRMPYIDIVFGTHNLHRLPDLLLELNKTGQSQCELYENLPDEVPETPIIRRTSVTAWVNIILGCNFNCTYCIVPQVRGREKSRTPDFIKQEIELLVSEGYKEVTLLGQNVTAYGLDFENGASLASLLRFIHDVPGLERIRFLTGHPYHVTDELIETVAELPKVCEYFHIPMQAGDDTTLRRMARIYSVDKYVKMADKIRELMPKASITSDFIVGFPGETHEQFLNTCKAVERIGFDSCITAMYSPRRNTPGAKWEEDEELKVSEEEKRERIGYLNALVTEIAEKESKKKYRDTQQEILIEGENPRNPKQLTGRTRQGKICNFDKPASNKINVGDLVQVKIDEITPWSLKGTLLPNSIESVRLEVSTVN
ncbi:MAG: tRNA (N6-isopentenyl adenosine(37)-C2)-methylthiotransferase MiaB [Candidatus Caenarcaniphilales bacterium]|nr:tRNA (N6-isopentenyl adenosine(37)-C2)-methylthiotransferase MiaB [Candidatus Caenarcaniphilales bacterium]